MSSINSGPAQTQSQNVQPLGGTFDAAGKLVQILGPGGVVAYDPSNVAITGGTIGGVPVGGYLGVVASRGATPSAQQGASFQSMSRSKHAAMENISSLQLVLANFFTTLQTETNPGAAAQYTASIEYPIGTLTRVLFGGATTGTAADGGLLVSDAATVAIPRGAAFYVRIWQANAAGILYDANWGLNNVSAAVPSSGEWWTYNTTTTDLTGSTANVNNKSTGNIYKPAAIIGYTTRPTFFIAGDSRLSNGAINDLQPNSYGGLGEVERSLVKRYATVNAGSPGDTMANAVSVNYSKRIQLAAYCSHVICEYGINDLDGGTTPATLMANLATFAAKFGGKPVFQTTITPNATSTDGFVTTGNQTPDPTSNANRITFNNMLRTGQFAAPVVGHIEVADQVESARDSGVWKAAGRGVSDAAITSGAAVLTSATASFTALDVGKPVVVLGAGAAGAALRTAIASFTNATTVSLSSNASTTVSTAIAGIGTNTLDGLHGTWVGNSLIEASAAFQGMPG